MIVRNVSRGRSFTKLAAYLTSEREGQHRALWSSVENVGATSAKTAAKIMAATDLHADELKAAAGVRATGRKAKDGPVYHLVMSWADGQQPEPTHQLQAARDMLESIGLERAQALIVAHNDNGREHLHIMVNLVDPDTGKRLSLSNDQHKMQEWALAYERKNGGVMIERREKNAEAWAKGEPQDKGDQIPRAAMDKAAKGQRRAWAEVKAERDAAYTAQAAERAAMRADHSEQWRTAKAEGASHKAAYKAAFRAAYATQKAVAKIESKPVWRDLFQRQKAERATIERVTFAARKQADDARRFAERDRKKLATAERRSRSLIGATMQRMGLALSPEQAAQRQQNSAAQMQAAALGLARAELAKAGLAAKQEADRRAVAAQISADTFSKAQLAVDTMPRADFAAMIRRQDEQRAAMIEKHNAQRAALGMKPYEPRPKGAPPMSEYELNRAKADQARQGFAQSADRRQNREQAERPKVQAATMQPTPAGQSKGTTPAAPDRAAIKQAEQAKEAAQARTAFKPQELQTRREGDKPLTLAQVKAARGADAPTKEQRDKAAADFAKATREGQSRNPTRGRDDFER